MKKLLFAFSLLIVLVVTASAIPINYVYQKTFAATDIFPAGVATNGNDLFCVGGYSLIRWNISTGGRIYTTNTGKPATDVDVDKGNYQIYVAKIDANYTEGQCYGYAGNPLFTYISKPLVKYYGSVAVDDGYNVYLLGEQGQIIFRYSNGGGNHNYYKGYSIAYPRGLESWKDPNTTAWHLYISDTNNCRILRVSVSGNTLSDPNLTINLPPGIKPYGAGLSKNYGELFVACSDGKVRQYNGVTGAYIRAFGGSPYMAQPQDVAVSADGLYVYVAEKDPTFNSTIRGVTQWKKIVGF